MLDREVVSLFCEGSFRDGWWVVRRETTLRDAVRAIPNKRNRSLLPTDGSLTRAYISGM